ncbi:hypothetical protein PghCCS26_47460 [Paenibacillus glycanilyticus]|uniref:Uncharacterized protein n=1 Tax=Paenibacillus glycanilyticus TaxID=126569 RepID=A0ABQ6NR84_9BACL|nr:hypothetical protein PghCCS26_47460 [Paenibacillus glycanilyticus]
MTLKDRLLGMYLLELEELERVLSLEEMQCAAFKKRKDELQTRIEQIKRTEGDPPS